jgi:aminoglycoside phosphotransferase (APT) family kinase protein
LVELGFLLAKLHAIPTKGIGPINGDGIAPKSSWSDYISTGADDQLLQAAANVRISPEHLQAACQLLAGCLPLWQKVQPRLLHGDLSLNHIMVDSGRISGLIDFEFPNSGDPAMDLAYWGCWDSFKGFSLPVQWIMEGYAQAAPVDESFELRVLASRLQLSLQLLRHHGIHDAGTPGIPVYLQQRFQRDIQALSHCVRS